MVDVAEFDGTRGPGAINDAILIGDSSELGLVGRDFTVEAWVKIAPHDPAHHDDLMVLGTPADGGANQGLHLGLRKRRLHLGFHDNDTSGTRELRDDRWYHLAWRYAEGRQTVFINGLVDAFNGSREKSSRKGRSRSDGPRKPFAGDNLEVRIGMSRDPTGPTWDSFVGRIAELRIWNHGVPEEKILERWTHRVRGDEQGLASYWPLDDLGAPSGPVDRVRGTSGTLLGRTASAADDTLPLFPVRHVQGIRFGAVAPRRFTLDWTRKLFPPDTARLAIEAWVRPHRTDQEAGPRPVLSQHGPSTGWELRAGRHAELMLTLGQEQVVLASTTPLRPDVWQHLLGVYDRSSLTLYVNGIRDAFMTVTGEPVWYDGPLSVAWNPNFGGRLYEGFLGDVRVWAAPNADPATLIRSVMWEGLPHDDPGPRVQFRFGTDAWLTEEVWEALRHEGLRLGKFQAPPIRLQSPDADDGASDGVPDGVPMGPPEGVAEADPVPTAPSADSERQKLIVEFERARQRIEQLEQELEASRLTAERRADSIAVHRKAADLDGDETTLEQFVRDMRAGIETARGEIDGIGGNYRLGRVTIQAKVLPGAKGRSIRFPAVGEVDGSLLSTIDLDFESAGTETVPALPTVPDVVGYTEPKARRELISAGFTAEVSYQSVDKREERDRVVDQRPLPDSARDPGTAVTVFIGKEMTGS